MKKEILAAARPPLLMQYWRQLLPHQAFVELYAAYDAHDNPDAHRAFLRLFAWLLGHHLPRLIAPERVPSAHALITHQLAAAAAIVHEALDASQRRITPIEIIHLRIGVNKVNDAGRCDEFLRTKQGKGAGNIPAWSDCYCSAARAAYAAAQYVNLCQSGNDDEAMECVFVPLAAAANACAIAALTRDVTPDEESDHMIAFARMAEKWVEFL